MSEMNKTALVLTGGGARGAYQAGVIAALMELLTPYGMNSPFEVLTGTSAGAINAALYATALGKEKNPGDELTRVWSSLKNSDIYRTDALELTSNSLNWLSSLTLGRGTPAKRSLSLLNTLPLRKLLKNNIDFNAIDNVMEQGLIKSFAISAINYETGLSRTFYMSKDEVRPWKREKREGILAKITHEHIMASAAIPLLFPPVFVENCYYGDGSLRDYSPLSPAIKLGASKLFVIGVRKRHMSHSKKCNVPSPGKIISMVLNGILLDAVDLDFERLQRINHTLGQVPGNRTDNLKKVETYLMTPSTLISEIAANEADQMERFLKYLLRGLGDFKDSADLISYILFQSPYTKKLIALGKQDVKDDQHNILKFFEIDIANQLKNFTRKDL